jgi:unsaturated rhamnogalacturonyl hydrolase
MNRRNFVFKTSVLGSTVSLFPAFTSKLKENYAQLEELPVTEKVTRAMLSMQRASWEQGTAAQAMLESGNDEMVYLMAKEAVLRQTEDGRLSVVYSDNGVTDPASAGEAVLYAYKKSGEEEFRIASDKMLEWLLFKAPRNKEGTIYHTMNSPEIWSDALYMAPPFIAKAGKYDEAIAQIEGIRKALWNTEHKLFSHRWHDVEQRFINSRFWGGGNGWAAAAYCRVIRTLPDNMKTEKDRIISYHRELLDGCLVHMREDGLFYNFINEPDTFVETNLSQMLAYSVFRGVKGSWLDDRYLKSAEKMRQAAYSKIDKHGYITGVCGAPMFQSPGRSTEGQAFFILMEAAYNELHS